jgi:hypothetical protein
MSSVSSIYTAFVAASILILGASSTGYLAISYLTKTTILLIVIFWTIFRLFYLFMISYDPTMLFSALLMIYLIGNSIYEMMPPIVRDLLENKMTVPLSPFPVVKEKEKEKEKPSKVKFDEKLLKNGIPPDD